MTGIHPGLPATLGDTQSSIVNQQSSIFSSSATIPGMDIILTHDNSDFDALASQLAAHKLTPEATPVLSKRLNRNVRHFLALYRDELPFISHADLSRRPIEQAIIVDTQHVQTVRGMSRKTAIQIIDHHARREDVPENWQISIEMVGATTTLLVEQIKEHK
ncbi:MAG: DHH family phosphoesterase, partial [Anaerolineae bacterium]|nr:DHH family phosphoesterase [Anaerolineae bacterium]